MLQINKNITYGFIWSVLGMFSNMLATLGVSFILAKMMSPDSFGIYSYLIAMVLTFSGFFQLSLVYSGSKFIAQYHSCSSRHLSQAISFTFYVGSLSVFIFLFVAYSFQEFFVSFVLDKSIGVKLISIVVLIISLHISVAIMLGVLTGLGQFRLTSIFQFFMAICLMTLVIVFYYIESLYGVFLGLLLAYSIQFLLLIYLVYDQLNKNGVKLINPFLLNDWLDKKILHFTVPAALSGFVILGLAMGANTILFTVEDGLYQAALLALVLNFKQIMLAFPNLLNRVLFVIFNNLYGMDEKKIYTKYFYKNLYGSVVLNFLFILIVLFLSGLIVQSFYGNKYGNIDALILLVSVWALLDTIFQALYQNIQVYGKMWESLFLVVFPANMIAFLIVYVFSHEYGAQAFILGYLIATLYSIIPALYLNKKIRASTIYAVENV